MNNRALVFFGILSVSLAFGADTAFSGGSAGGGGGSDRPVNLAAGPRIVCGEYFCGVILKQRPYAGSDFFGSHDQLQIMRLKDEARSVGVCRMEFDNAIYAAEVCPTNLKILETEKGYACGCPRGMRSIRPRD
jgi:hypothetical protein